MKKEKWRFFATAPASYDEYHYDGVTAVGLFIRFYCVVGLGSRTDKDKRVTSVHLVSFNHGVGFWLDDQPELDSDIQATALVLNLLVWLVLPLVAVLSLVHR